MPLNRIGAVKLIIGDVKENQFYFEQMFGMKQIDHYSDAAYDEPIMGFDDGAHLALFSPKQEPLRYVANALQSTITDLVAEVHDTHHPLATTLYYEDQKDAAKTRAADFLRHRLPKFAGYFERALKQNPAGDKHVVGDSLTYVDLSLFQCMDGLHYAFPRAMKGFETTYPALGALRRRVRARPRIAAYLKSERRIPFNESGIFRHYPELDQDAG